MTYLETQKDSSSGNELLYSSKDTSVFASIHEAYDVVTQFFVALVGAVWAAKVDALNLGLQPEHNKPQVIHIAELLPDDTALAISRYAA